MYTCTIALKNVFGDVHILRRPCSVLRSSGSQEDFMICLNESVRVGQFAKMSRSFVHISGSGESWFSVTR